MTPFSIELPRELLDELIHQARDAGAEAARAVIRAEAVAPVPAQVAEPIPELRFARIGEYARRVGLSPRKVQALIATGLPTIGRRRLRRVDVEAADRWLERHLADLAPPAKV